MVPGTAAVLTLPGARGPVAASILGSLPIGMFGLAILLLARDATGSFALAGRVAGASGSRTRSARCCRAG